MSREDDREYWHRQDERRDRDREIWRDQDLRDEDRRWDQSRDERRRGEEVQEGWRSLRRGDTAWALRNLAGPDAALDYLRMTEGSAASHEPEPGPAKKADWPKHAFVETVTELVENLESVPAVEFEIGSPDQDGDVLVRALFIDPFMDSPLGQMWTSMRGGQPHRTEHGRFWVRATLLRQLHTATTVLERTAALVRDLPKG